MTPSRKDDEPLFAREGLFRQKLNQLRTTGEISRVRNTDSQARLRELEQSAYLQNAQNVMTNADPQEMERLTLLDSLTQIYNHNTIVRIFREDLKRARRYKNYATVLMVAVDNLREIQAQRGALVSDSILKGVANFLMKEIRDVDIPSRYDGWHFAIVCPETDPSGVQVLAERLRNKIITERVSDVGQNWAITLSMGIAGFPAHGMQAEDLFHRALQALQESEMSGGNTFRVAQ